MGGPTALNVALQLYDEGTLARHGVELIGANARPSAWPSTAANLPRPWTARNAPTPQQPQAAPHRLGG
jgi:hypothetical protein